MFAEVTAKISEDTAKMAVGTANFVGDTLRFSEDTANIARLFEVLPYLVLTGVDDGSERRLQSLLLLLVYG